MIRDRPTRQGVGDLPINGPLRVAEESKIPNSAIALFRQGNHELDDIIEIAKSKGMQRKDWIEKWVAEGGARMLLSDPSKRRQIMPLPADALEIIIGELRKAEILRTSDLVQFIAEYVHHYYDTEQPSEDFVLDLSFAASFINPTRLCTNDLELLAGIHMKFRPKWNRDQLTSDLFGSYLCNRTTLDSLEREMEQVAQERDGLSTQLEIATEELVAIRSDLQKMCVQLERENPGEILHDIPQYKSQDGRTIMSSLTSKHADLVYALNEQKHDYDKVNGERNLLSGVLEKLHSQQDEYLHQHGELVNKLMSTNETLMTDGAHKSDIIEQRVQEINNLMRDKDRIEGNFTLFRDRHDELREKYQKLERSCTEMVSKIRANEGEYRAQTRELDELRQELDKSNKLCESREREIKDLEQGLGEARAMINRYKNGWIGKALFIRSCVDREYLIDAGDRPKRIKIWTKVDGIHVNQVWTFDEENHLTTLVNSHEILYAPNLLEGTRPIFIIPNKTEAQSDQAKWIIDGNLIRSAADKSKVLTIREGQMRWGKSVVLETFCESRREQKWEIDQVK